MILLLHYCSFKILYLSKQSCFFYLYYLYLISLDINAPKGMIKLYNSTIDYFKENS